MKCVNCKNNILMEENGEQFSWCKVKNDNFDIHEERTCCEYCACSNADKLRASNDEQLAEFISKMIGEFFLKISEEVFRVNISTIRNPDLKEFSKGVLETLKENAEKEDQI